MFGTPRYIARCLGETLIGENNGVTVPYHLHPYASHYPQGRKGGGHKYEHDEDKESLDGR